MRRLMSVLACGCVLALAGCSDSHDKVMADSLDVMSDMNDILDGVTDKSSAEAAKPKLEALGERMEDIKARHEKLGDANAEQKKALEQKYQERMGKEAGRMLGNAFRIGTKPEIASVLDDAMSTLEPPGDFSFDASGPPPGMTFPGGDMPEMTNPTEGAFGTENPSGAQNPFGSDGDTTTPPAESQPADDAQPE